MIRTPLNVSRALTREDASRIVQTAGRFASRVMLSHRDTLVNGKSILGLLSLCSMPQTGLELVCDGEDEQAAARAVAEAFFSSDPPEGL